MINGYEYEYNPTHHRATKNGCVYKHIIVAEEILGRPLTKDEVVHHKDKNRSNNNIENIMVFKTKGDHTRFHKTNIAFLQNDGTYISPMIKTACPICGYEKYDDAKMCQNCRIKQQSKNVPPKGVLIKLLNEKLSREAIGRIYGVTGNAVKKWLIKYQLI